MFLIITIVLNYRKSFKALREIVAVACQCPFSLAKSLPTPEIIFQGIKTSKKKTHHENEKHAPRNMIKNRPIDSWKS